jgi:HTH-type transcriptional regulator/antitoxin HipB
MHPINDPRQIGATLTGRRKHLKLSQTDVAARLGLSQNRLSELESSPQTLTVEQLLALLNVLGLEMSLRERDAGGKPKVEW